MQGAGWACLPTQQTDLGLIAMKLTKPPQRDGEFSEEASLGLVSGADSRTDES